MRHRFVTERGFAWVNAELDAAATDGFFRPIVYGAAFASLAALGCAWLLGSARMVVLGLVFAAFSAVSAWGERTASKAELERAVLGVGYGGLALVFLIGPLNRLLAAALLLVPLLAMVSVLPHLRGRKLWAFVVAGFVVELWLIAFTAMLPLDPSVPLWFQASVLTLALTVSAYVTLVLLVAFSDRLRRTLEEVRQSEERFKSLTLATTQIVWTSDVEGTIRADSPSWRAFTGQTFEEFAGTGWHQAIHPEDRARVLDLWYSALREQVLFEAEYGLRRVDGLFIPMVSRAAPVFNPDGSVREWVGTNTDITDRRRYEDSLREAIRARDEFLGQASHELKTPLTSLKLQIQGIQALSLRTPTATVTYERVGQKLQVMSKQVGRLGSLIDDLLDISRITAGRLSLRPEDVDLVEVLHEVVDRSSEQIAQSGCEIELDVDESVMGHWDPLRLDQVVTNLLVNALKYGAGTPVEIRIHATPSTAVLEIQDHGIGISAEDQPRIFERFERAASSRHYGGIGLGLWIVRQVVSAHSGEVRVHSAPGEGAIFSVVLPRWLAREQSSWGTATREQH